MDLDLLPIPTYSALVSVLASVVIMRYFWPSSSGGKQVPSHAKKTVISPSKAAVEPTDAIKKLAAAFPSQVTISQDQAAITAFRSSYWAQQCADVAPACIVRPESTADVAKVLAILHEEHVSRQRSGNEHGYFFALRSGGHSPYDSVLEKGIIVDMSAFDKTELSHDTKTVTIGCGARWGTVVQALEDKGLAVVSGRDTKVGAGGLTLGGGVSFLSPRYGFVASNVINFEVVLASGQVVTASATEHPDLWKALKGGSSSFGVVTRMTFPTFPSSTVWAGFIYLPGFEARRTLAALQDWVMRDLSGEPDLQYDENAAGPIGCFTYINDIRMHALAVHMLHTKAKDSQTGWAPSFKSSSFKSLWRIWSTFKVQKMTSALAEISATNPNGKRQVFGTTTVISDLETLQAAHDIHLETVQTIRNTKPVKGLIWNFIMQPILPQWATKGDPGPVGFSKSDTTPLMLVSFCNSWEKSEDDELINSETRRAIERIEAMARDRKMDHPYRYLNYCGDWQRPFETYGAENCKFLQNMSRKYDEHGLFQNSLTGSFKLFDKESER